VISQPVDNVLLPSQNGGEFVVKAGVDTGGGDLLIGFSGSAWSAVEDQLISLQLWLDDEPVPSGLLQLYANASAMHLCLGHVWAHVPGVGAGEHTLAVMAGDTTTTDQNDSVCITVWEMGDNLAVHFNESVPCPEGVGQPLVETAFQTQGQTPVMVSASTSGWTAGANAVIGATATIDQDTDAAASLEVFANNALQHLPAVPTEIIFAPPNRGQHELTVVSEGSTSTDGGDLVHVTALEWVNPAEGPTIVELSPPLQNAVAVGQQGGAMIAQTTFQSSGGPLLVCTNLSAWSATQNATLGATIQIDAVAHGYVGVFANWMETHLPLVSNDLVIAGIPAGEHTLVLRGTADTITDANDRVSVTILEFPAS
jgi:hypothetical protein